MLVCNNQLSTTQLSALGKLARLCAAVDKDLPPLYKHILRQKRVSDNNFFYYKDKELIGFLSVFFFYADACEISLMIAPKFRRQGKARRMLKAALPLIQTKGIGTLLFSNPAATNDAWLTPLGFSYKNSEYHMERHSVQPILITKQALAVRQATEADIPILCAIDELCFPVEPDNMYLRLMNLLSDKSYTIRLAFYDSKPVGKAHVRWQGQEAIFSDIAITPQYQRKGLGSELLAHCINHALAQGKNKLALDVETSNQGALNLYKRYDFNTVNAIDFWAIRTEKLNSLLQSC
jgi:ribosomal protein S18 acetylase RimI-like enzyme